MLKMLKNIFGSFNPYINILSHDIVLTIPNPNVENRDIEVHFEKQGLTFYFSYQHAHFGYDDITGLIDYIESFLTNQIAAVEFFEGDQNRCGGSREYSSLDLSTAEKIVAIFYSESQVNIFMSNKWTIYVQCWDSSLDKTVSVFWDGHRYSVTEIA